MAANALKFFKRNILTRFGISQAIVTDNGNQFINKNLKPLLEELKIKQYFVLVEHPQINGLTEALSRVFLKGLKRRLQIAKGNWADETPHIL